MIEIKRNDLNSKWCNVMETSEVNKKQELMCERKSRDEMAIHFYPHFRHLRDLIIDVKINANICKQVELRSS